MLDESLLDDPAALARSDTRGALRGAAEAGARVRTAARLAAESGLAALKPDGRPRALFVAGPGPATDCAAGLLDALLAGACPAQVIRPTGADAAPGVLRWSLPGWANPLDLVLVVTGYGSEPGLEALVEQAYRRGCAVVAVIPHGAPLAEAVGTTHGMVLPLIPLPAAEPGAPEPPGALWALLTPLLALCDRLGLLAAPPEALERVATRLDETAERCGPAIDTYSNPAKTLATELAESVPLLWSDGPVAAAAGRHFAAALAGVAGRPALADGLPHALQAHAALLDGEFAGRHDPDDFFRDRVEEAQELRTRVVLLREGPQSGTSAEPAARDLAHSRGAPLSELEPAEGSSALEAAAELIATADFAAVYLALASSPEP